MPDSSVSIVIPCHNDGAYLREALASAFAQTAQNTEIILVDDGSTDPETIELITELATDPRLIVIRSQQCQGPAAARNHAIHKAKGRFILPLDADDLIMPTYVEKACTFLERDSRLEIVYCRVRWFGLARGEWKLPSYDAANFVLENTIFATAMFRRSTWEAVGGYGENMIDGMEDYDFWMKILAIGGAVHQIDEPLFHYRVKPKSRTARLKDENRAVERRAYRTLFENNIDYFCRPENVRIIYFSLLARLRAEKDQRSSFLWRLLFRHFVRLELIVQTWIKRMVGRA